MPGKLKLTAEWRRSSTVRSESTPQSGKGALLDGLSCSGHKAEDLLYKGSLRQHVTPGHGTHLSLGQHRHCRACRKVFHARFASELRSAEPAEYQPWIAF